MNVTDYKQEIQKLLGKDLIKEVIELLGDSLRKGTEFYEDAIMTSARYYRANRERAQAVISEESYTLEMNKIIGSLFILLDEAADNDFNDNLSIGSIVQEKATKQVQEIKITEKEYAGIRVKYDLLKAELALIIDISHPMQQHVIKHFKGNNKVTLVHITSRSGQRQLDPDNRKEWEGIVRGISQFLMAVSEINAPEKLHIFLAAPSALGLTLGCTLRNLSKPYIYHFDRDHGEYRLIAVADDRLRSINNTSY